jgi:hypothetical protein
MPGRGYPPADALWLGPVTDPRLRRLGADPDGRLADGGDEFDGGRPAGPAYWGMTPPPNTRPRPQSRLGQAERRGSLPGRGSGPEGARADGRPVIGGRVIRQQDSADQIRRRIGATQPIAAIAPDGLEAFARDLRALRAKAELDYPDMAERSHYTMKTLASAAGGLRLPTLPVTIAYVRACGGDTSEWEDRWHKLADRLDAEAAKKPRADLEENPEPGTESTPPEQPQSAHEARQASEVFVITSAKPRHQGWQQGP